MLLTCQNVRDFTVLQPVVNFSDHLPLLATVTLSTSGAKSGDHSSFNRDVEYPRWDKADTGAYYEETRVYLALLLTDLDRLLNYNERIIDKALVSNIIDQLYERIVFVLRDAESHFVLKHCKTFYKFW